MTYLKVNIKRASFLFLLLFGLGMAAPLPATTYPPDYVNSLAFDKPDEFKIKIKIIIIIIKKKPKVAEVVNFLLDDGVNKLKENEFWAEVEIVKNTLNIKMADPDLEDMTVIVPEGIRVPQEIAKQLGRKGSFKIAGGKIQMEGDKLGNFEIQR